jgi:hypothetical protein
MVDNETCYSLPTQCLIVGCDNFASLVFLEIKGLEEVNKYSFLSPSSLIVVKLNSVERMDSAFLCALLTACSLFRIHLPFECINFFKKEAKPQILLSESSFGFKASIFLLFKFGNCSAISRVVVVLFTIVTPHIRPLRIFWKFAYTCWNSYDS